MTKKKPKTFILDLGVFPFDVMVSTDTFENVVKSIRKTGYKLCDAELQGLNLTGDGRTLILEGG